ncbi:unnamed protein product [Trichobilharzia szidati]|nr:unnamed protein product [Trichobilharzia szidati]
MASVPCFTNNSNNNNNNNLSLHSTSKIECQQNNTSQKSFTDTDNLIPPLIDLSSPSFLNEDEKPQETSPEDVNNTPSMELCTVNSRSGILSSSPSLDINNTPKDRIINSSIKLDSNKSPTRNTTTTTTTTATASSSTTSTPLNRGSRHWKNVQCTMKVVLATMDHVKRRRKTNYNIAARRDSFMDRFSTQRRGTYAAEEYLNDATFNDQLYALKRSDNLLSGLEDIDKKVDYADGEQNTTAPTTTTAISGMDDSSQRIKYSGSYKEISSTPEKEYLLAHTTSVPHGDESFSLHPPKPASNHCMNKGRNFSDELSKSDKLEVDGEKGNPKNSTLSAFYKKSHMYIVFHPHSTGYVIWLTFVSLALLYNLWTPIARQAFDELQSKYQTIWLSFDIVADITYLIDIFVQCNTSYLKCGLKVRDHQKLAMRYLKSYQFLLDVASLIPLDLLQFKFGVQPMLRFPRFLKCYRCREWKLRVENRTIFPNIWRVLNLIHILFLGCHWFAAFYYLISKYEGFKSPWGYQPYADLEQVTMSRRYLKSFYWATLTLTTIGDLNSPSSSIELTFTIVSYLIGVFIFATIVGQVGNIITTRNAHRTEFEKILDNAKSYMRTNSVSKDLQSRILLWYDYAWSKGSGGGQDINSLGMLPDKLKTELALNVNLETLKKVTIFHECRPEFLHDIVLKMRPLVLTPGDLICRKGEIARDIYIIADGVLEVLNEDNEVLSTMSAGDFFGEIGVLNLDGINRRTADVRAVGYAELFVLSREDILKALKDHPEAEIVIRKHAARRLCESRTRRAGNAQGGKSPSGGSTTTYSPTLSPLLYKQGNLFSTGNSTRSSTSTPFDQNTSKEISRLSINPTNGDSVKQNDKNSSIRKTATNNNLNLAEKLLNTSCSQNHQMMSMADAIDQFTERWENILGSLVEIHRKELSLLKEQLLQYGGINQN